LIGVAQISRLLKRTTGAIRQKALALSMPIGHRSHAATVDRPRAKPLTGDSMPLYGAGVAFTNGNELGVILEVRKKKRR
jgi:hypothetical protein